MPEKPQSKYIQDCFPQPKDSSVRVWRYLNLAKLIWLLEKQKLYLTRLDLMSDEHEGSIPVPNAIYREFQLLAIQRNMHLEDFDDDLIKHIHQGNSVYNKLRRWMYVNCWHMGNMESEAMWRLYCPENSGVAIQTIYSKLANSVASESELHIGMVAYIDYESQSIPMNSVFAPVMHKRISFSHEHEIRLVKVRPPDNWGTPHEFSPPGISISWPLEQTVESIYVNPYAPEYFYEAVCSVVRNLAPNLEDRVLWSRMKAPPVY